jgi:hypothetical protein
MIALNVSECDNKLFAFQDGDDDSGSGSPQKTTTENIITNDNDLLKSQESLPENSLIVEISDALSEKDRVSANCCYANKSIILQFVYFLGEVHSSHENNNARN